MTPQITIELRNYEQLVEDSNAFNKIKKENKFIHYSVWCGLGGLRTEITSNDTRLAEIKEQSHEDAEQIRILKDHTINKLEQEIKELKSLGFFKRLFS